MKIGSDVREDLKVPSLGVWARDVAIDCVAAEHPDAQIIDNEKTNKHRIEINGRSVAVPDILLAKPDGSRVAIDCKGKSEFGVGGVTGIDIGKLDDYQTYVDYHKLDAGGIIFVHPTGKIRDTTAELYERVGVYRVTLDALYKHGKETWGGPGQRMMSIGFEHLRPYPLHYSPRFVLGRINYYKDGPIQKSFFGDAA